MEFPEKFFFQVNLGGFSLSNPQASFFIGFYTRFVYKWVSQKDVMLSDDEILKLTDVKLV